VILENWERIPLREMTILLLISKTVHRRHDVGIQGSASRQATASPSWASGRCCSAWGWVGGLMGSIQILKHGRPYPNGKDGLSPFGKPTISPATCQILTYNDIATFRDEDHAGAFGGDPSSQMLGLTICVCVGR